MADRYYVVCSTPDEWVERDFVSDPEIRASLHGYVDGLFRDRGIAVRFEVLGVPASPPRDLPPERASSMRGGFVVALDVSGGAEAYTALHRTILQTRERGGLLAGGADVPIAASEHWCPREAPDPIFGDRAAAERLIGVDRLRADHNLTGAGVNVVIVDGGIDRHLIEKGLGGTYGDGWPAGGVLPGTVASKHGMMIARNILRTAPKATIYDLPLLPERIYDLPAFLSVAQSAYHAMLAYIDQHRGPWILVNAWSLFDRRIDLAPPADYCNGPTHAFNILIADAVREGCDVVFCAGNCGQFCPDGRCGVGSIGPGFSILGANSHPDVLTVGAVRADETWLGYSSQGPGQPLLAADKPDLCAASQFADDDDAFGVNTGTSAACAMAAGAIALLRQDSYIAQLAPGTLIEGLKSTARRPPGAAVPERFGSGILDAPAAFDALRGNIA